MRSIKSVIWFIGILLLYQSSSVVRPSRFRVIRRELEEDFDDCFNLSVILLVSKVINVVTNLFEDLIKGLRILEFIIDDFKDWLVALEYSNDAIAGDLLAGVPVVRKERVEFRDV